MLSKLLRRIHMYLGLFFMPWMLMYALSTIVMNHRQFFSEIYGGEPAPWEIEQEQTYPGAALGEDAVTLGRRILQHLNLDGAYTARKSSDGERIHIFRDDPVTPRRITYVPADRRLVVEKQVFRAQAFLERMHRRRGFQNEDLASDVWGLTVDFAIAAMILWVLTGLWMWWELKRTRAVGLLAFTAGASLFMFFLFTI